jgi:hypothetical protein
MKTAPSVFNWSAPATWSPESFAHLSQPADDHWDSIEPGPRILVVAHDAGGAEILAAWINRRLKRASRGQAPPLQAAFLLEGPALRVFARAGLVADSTGTLNRPRAFSADETWDWILTGTGWASDLEQWALQQAHRRQLMSCSFLDHWINYRERFTMTDGRLILPNQVWVGDPWAETLAREAFGSQSSIRLVPNPYFAAMRADFEKSGEVRVSSPNHQRFLYVTEPISAAAASQQGNLRWYGYTEFEALERFCRWLQTQTEFSVEALRLRPHPSEAPDKYSATFASRSLNWHQSPPGHSLLQDCLWSDVVVGCNTMALIVGWLAERRILCSIPEQAPPCSLPLPVIKRLFPQR